MQNEPKSQSISLPAERGLGQQSQMLKVPHHHHWRGQLHQQRGRRASPEISDEYLFKIYDTENINIKEIQLKTIPIIVFNVKLPALQNGNLKI